MNVTTKDRTIKTSAWFFYTLIVLEILFMVSPFAAYYYSIYATPLNALQESQFTAWLTMYLLPHFAYSDSWLANGLILISWPLILAGAVLFVFGFCQIYWSKLMSRGAVEAGLYRFIRHPQYVALAVIGLGSSLYWSRFIVVIAFVSMLCLYYFLARVEERICLTKFGDSYREYLERTGMFLPRRWEAQWRALDWRLPEVRWRRVTVVAGLYAAVLSLTIGGAYLLRNHVIASMHTDVDESQVTVYLAPVGLQTRTRVAEILGDSGLQADIIYVAPSSWQIPELGLIASTPGREGGSMDELFHPTTHGNALSFVDELFHPTTHGNALSFAGDRLNVVLAQATYATDEPHRIGRLSKALNVRPITFASLNLAGDQIIELRDASDSQWAGIPVPTF